MHRLGYNLVQILLKRRRETTCVLTDWCCTNRVHFGHGCRIGCHLTSVEGWRNWCGGVEELVEGWRGCGGVERQRGGGGAVEGRKGGVDGLRG